MPWQEILAGSIVVAAGLYVVWRFRGGKDESPGSDAPDVPVTRLTKKRSKSGSCQH